MSDLTDSITEFIFAEDAPQKADVILVCGSARLEPARRAAELYREGYAPYVLATGRYGERYSDFRTEMIRVAENDGRDPAEYLRVIEEQAGLAGHSFPETEWAYQRDALVLAGVPEQAILREDRSVNTFENALFARRLLEERGIPSDRLILCCQAFHARRAKMTIATEFPNTKILVCPAATRGITRTAWHRTADGYDKVMDELQKCGTYFRGERMYRAFAQQIPASDLRSTKAEG